MPIVNSIKFSNHLPFIKKAFEIPAENKSNHSYSAKILFSFQANLEIFFTSYKNNVLFLRTFAFFIFQTIPLNSIEL